MTINGELFRLASGISMKTIVLIIFLATQSLWKCPTSHQNANGLDWLFKLFVTSSDEELEAQLCKYLLRTLCTDITNLLLSSVVTSENLMSDVDPTTLTAEVNMVPYSPI